MNEQEKQLRVIRDDIDRIDRQIHQLLNDRATCAQKVAEIKQKFQGEDSAVFYRPEREAQVLREVMKRNQGPLPDKEMARLFREVMSVCLALEKPMRIAFLGPAGTYTQQAALKHFGHSAISAPMNTLDEVFREVESGSANYGVVPIENSAEGLAHHTLDLFSRFHLKICGEVELQIHHHLLVRAGAGVENLQRIYATRQALVQCSSWLEAHCPGIERITVDSNAEAAKLLADDSGSAAAIGGEMAAELYPLDVAARNIEDQSENITRFLILGDQEVGPSGEDKTSVLVSTHNEPGALYDILGPFRQHQISLTRIETRPAKGAEESVFYIDFEGHEDDQGVKPLLTELENATVELRMLGSYPKAVL